MSKTNNSPLLEFNTLALRFQDDAFTFAYYLLGDEVLASEATQAAFTSLYRSAEKRFDQFRLEVLRWVLANCRRVYGALPRPRQGDTLSIELQHLVVEERAVVVLVDVLGLPYDEAARVLDIPREKLIRLLALGRLRLTRE